MKGYFDDPIIKANDVIPLKYWLGKKEVKAVRRILNKKPIRMRRLRFKIILLEMGQYGNIPRYREPAYYQNLRNIERLLKE